MEVDGKNKLAEENGFFVLYPTQKFINNISLCFNWFKDKDISKDSGESGSIKNMVDYVIENFEIDRQRIFIYSLSAGAPHGIATNGIQGVKVMISVPNKTSEEWGQEIPDYDARMNYPKLIIVHGEDDNVVNIKSSFELIKQWRYLKKVGKQDRRLEDGFRGNDRVQRISYIDSSQQECIVFYQIKGVGNEITVDEGNENHQGGKANMYAVDIGFYSTYYVAKDFGIVKE